MLSVTWQAVKLMAYQNGTPEMIAAGSWDSKTGEVETDVRQNRNVPVADLPASRLAVHVQTEARKFPERWCCIRQKSKADRMQRENHDRRYQRRRPRGACLPIYRRELLPRPRGRHPGGNSHSQRRVYVPTSSAHGVGGFLRHLTKGKGLFTKNQKQKARKKEIIS